MATINVIDSNKPIEVALGGTGAASFTAHSPLIGNGTGAIQAITTGTNGQVLIAATGANPAFAAPTSTLGSITYTTGAGSLNLDVTNWVAETSWTPALTFGGGSTALTYTTQTGTYIRMANAVYFQMEIVLSAKGSSTGSASIGGLPLTASAINYVSIIRFSNLTFSGQVSTSLAASGTAIILTSATSGGAKATLDDTAFVNTTAVQIIGSYFV